MGRYAKPQLRPLSKIAYVDNTSLGVIQAAAPPITQQQINQITATVISEVGSGIQGPPGTPGITPIKGVDYFDGVNGSPGVPGYTPIKGVDYFDGIQGLKGDKGDQGNQGLPGSDATVTKSAVESVLTGEITTHTHPGGGGGLTQQQIEGIL